MLPSALTAFSLCERMICRLPLWCSHLVAVGWGGHENTFSTMLLSHRRCGHSHPPLSAFVNGLLCNYGSLLTTSTPLFVALFTKLAVTPDDSSFYPTPNSAIDYRRSPNLLFSASHPSACITKGEAYLANSSLILYYWKVVRRWCHNKFARNTP